MSNEYKIPGDILEVYHMLKSIMFDLTDTMMMDFQEWKDELIGEVKSWKSGDDEPNWNSYRNWMNDICIDDGMPILFDNIGD